MKYILATLALLISLSLNADSVVWKTFDGKAVPDSESLKSTSGFGGMLVVTPDPDWAQKWNTPPETVPKISTASNVKYGDSLTILIFFTNPLVNERGEIKIACDIKAKRPDGTYSIDAKDIDCASGKLQGKANNIMLSNAVVKFTAEEDDLPGVWVIEILLKDSIRNVKLELKTKYNLLKSK